MTKDAILPERLIRERFDDDFLFFRGDPKNVGERLSYREVRPYLLPTGAEYLNAAAPKPVRPAGNPGGKLAFVAPDFDDRHWRRVTLPHDYAIEGPFSIDLPGETGKLPYTGPAWYRKHFRLPARDRATSLFLVVEGAQAYSQFWLNGQHVGGWPYGYSTFRIDLTAAARFGGPNLLAVRLDNPHTSSRWYPGSGLYRHLWLERRGPVRLAHDGVFVSTPEVSPRRALVRVDTAFENTLPEGCHLEVKTELFALDEAGLPSARPVASTETIAFDISAQMTTLRTAFVELKRPRLWDTEHCHLYRAVTTLSSGGRLRDRVETTFGVRSIEFTADRGFLLNGQKVPLRGVCLHHDLGALGAAAHDRGIERQLTILKEMGCNAIRTSHNPPAPTLLDLCDRMGFLVMNEAFDCWRRGKKHPYDKKPGDPGFVYYDYAAIFDDWHEIDLRAMLRRDRNHPSIVCISIGNEVMEQWTEDGYKLAVHMAGIAREEDRTRPLTSAFNGESSGYNGYQCAVDIIGFNYKPTAYRRLRDKNPVVPIVGSETASTISTRSEYFFPVSDDKHHGKVNFQVSSYDLSTASWALTPDQEFRGLDECPFVAGEFVWTGFDYLGEPTPYNSDVTNLLNFTDPEQKRAMQLELDRLGKIRVPSRSSYFGIIDLAGFPKDRFYLYQARFRPQLRMAHILPHWNWPERVGEVTPVHVYSSGDEAELFLNKKSQGVRRRGRFEYRFRWDDVVYEPGELKVVVKKGGRRWATATRRTTGPANRLSLTADRTELRADGRDLCFVTVRVLDARGDTVPRCHPMLRFSVKGPAGLLALDNGDPTCLESFVGREHSAFHGLCLAVLRTSNKPGQIRLEVSAEGLATERLVVRSSRAGATDARPSRHRSR